MGFQNDNRHLPASCGWTMLRVSRYCKATYLTTHNSSPYLWFCEARVYDGCLPSLPCSVTGFPPSPAATLCESEDTQGQGRKGWRSYLGLALSACQHFISFTRDARSLSAIHHPPTPCLPHSESALTLILYQATPHPSTIPLTLLSFFHGPASYPSSPLLHHTNLTPSLPTYKHSLLSQSI